MGGSTPVLRNALPDTADDVLDIVDVPAAVVCTRCGCGDCPGCHDEDTTASGIVAIVPWERQGANWRVRFYETAQATTGGAEGFFLLLPDGAVRTALSFAVVSEALAVVSTALVLSPLTVLGVPGLLHRFLASSATRVTVVWATLAGVLGFSLLLVGAHAVHGLALGRPGTRTRALRMGLYGCGWDFGSSPAGVAWAIWRSGVPAALRLFASSLTAPSRAVDAALLGLHLDAQSAARTKRRAMTTAMLVSVPAVMVVLALVAAIALFST